MFQQSINKTGLDNKSDLSRTQVKIASGAIVCTEQTNLIGDISIGTKTVVHPSVSIIASHGPIVIGDFNLIEEHVKIVNKSEETMRIGSYNVFEVGCSTESLEIGDQNVLESKSFLGRKTLLSNGCVIGAKCYLNSDELLQENTIVFGNDCKRRIGSEKPIPQTFQLDFLSKIMPNYQTFEKPNWKPNASPSLPQSAKKP